MQRLATRLRLRRRRRLFLRSAAAAAAVVVIAGGGGLLWLAPGDPRPGGLSCAEVEKLVDAYAKSTLDEATRAKVRQHVAQCPRCGPQFRAMDLPT
jgi:anti-sigma factor RsiW